MEIVVKGKIHLVVNVAHVKPWVPMSDGAVPRPLLLQFDQEGLLEFEVEKIMDQWMVKGVMEYRVRWKGYGIDKDT